MKAYITAYALSRGIIVAEDSEKNHLRVEEGRLYVSGYDSFGSGFSKTEWHDNLEDAIKDAEARRDKKLLSLKKQMKKLEETNFAETLKTFGEK